MRPFIDVSLVVVNGPTIHTTEPKCHSDQVDPLVRDDVSYVYKHQRIILVGEGGMLPIASDANMDPNVN